MTSDEPSIAGLALSVLLWATAVILTGAFVYSLTMPRAVCSGEGSTTFGARDTIAEIGWPPPVLRCATGTRFDGKTAAEREWTTLWDWPQLAAVVAIDVLALAEVARRARAASRRAERDDTRQGWPPRRTPVLGDQYPRGARPP